MKINKKYELNEEMLTETSLGDAARGIKNAEVQTNGAKGIIEQDLDDILEASEEVQAIGSSEYPSYLLEGEAGIGKTARVKKWARENGINLYIVQAATMDETDLGGAISPGKSKPDETLTPDIVKRLASTEFDKLDRPRSVLFLDEYNRAPATVRGTLLTLINDHLLPDPREELGMRFLPNLLFVVAAINPGTSGQYNTDVLDPAERSRFMYRKVGASRTDSLDFFRKDFGKLVDKAKESGNPKYITRAEGRLKIAETLLSSPQFEFDTAADTIEGDEDSQILNPRSLTKLITICNGTKEDFLNKWDMICNPRKKGMAERILSNYEDVEDKANELLKQGTTSAVFGKRENTAFDDLMGMF